MGCQDRCNTPEMFGLFNNQKQSPLQYPRNQRQELKGQVYIKRPGKDALKGNCGNISEGGLYVELANHDLEKGKKVEIILVRQNEKVKEISRMMGIVIRPKQRSVALVTYKNEDLRSVSEKDLLF